MNLTLSEVLKMEETLHEAWYSVIADVETESVYLDAMRFIGRLRFHIQNTLTSDSVAGSRI